MQLFYAPLFSPPAGVLPPDESRHAVRVLRLAAGSSLHLTDGRGGLFECRVTAADERACGVEAIKTLPVAALKYRLTLAVAPTKNSDRMEWMVEKTTEVGVHRLVPLLTEHTERPRLNPERLGRLVVAAAKQSLKTYFPVVEPLTKFSELITTPFEGQKFIAHCEPGEKDFLLDALQPGGDVLILIGPEGDFSPSEIALAREHGFTEISLGTARLRTETAGIAATVLTAAKNE